MGPKSIFIIIGVVISNVNSKSCYWNTECPHHLFSSKTPYDAVRGDLRDYEKLDNCEAVSIWSLNRHGNRNPGDSNTVEMKAIAQLKEQIIQSYDEGKGEMCAQDIDLFRRWTWNETLEVSPSFLTGVGYEELYNIAARIRQTYPELLNGRPDDYYFRATNEQRTVTSGIAFIHGFTDGTNLSVIADEIREEDDVIRPYENCVRYQETVKNGPTVIEEMQAFMDSPEYVAIQQSVQRRLGITYQLTAMDIYNFYENCRFDRSWTPDLKSPWCSVFTNEDLVVLEYRDDIRHFYRNGYGSWPTVVWKKYRSTIRLPFYYKIYFITMPMRDLYETFQAAHNGSSRKVTAYFTHDTMMEMTYCAMGLYKDKDTLYGNDINYGRLWRSSYLAPFSSNLLFVLNRCQESGSQVYRVQIYNNEIVTEICPIAGCTWAQFEEIFSKFSNANLDFCSLDYPEPEDQSLEEIDPVPDNASALKVALWLFLLQLLLLLR